MAGSVVDDLIDLSGDDFTDEDEMMQGMGFKRDNAGMWKKEPDLVLNEPREWYEDMLRGVQRKLDDSGSLYLGNGSWPATVHVIAGGKRYHSSRLTSGDRAWFGYISGVRMLVLMHSRTDHECIELSEDPDIVSALVEVKSF